MIGRMFIIGWCVVFLAGCVTTGQPGRKGTSPAVVRKHVYMTPEQEANIREANKKLSNLYSLSEKKLYVRFGKPQRDITDPDDPSGNTRLLHFQSSDGRIIDVKIRGEKILDVNYTATGSGGGHGGGRRGKEKEEARQHRLANERVARGIVREMYRVYGGHYTEKTEELIHERGVQDMNKDVHTFVVDEIAAIEEEERQAQEAAAAQAQKEAEEKARREAERRLREEREREAAETARARARETQAALQSLAQQSTGKAIPLSAVTASAEMQPGGGMTSSAVFEEKLDEKGTEQAFEPDNDKTTTDKRAI